MGKEVRNDRRVSCCVREIMAIRVDIPLKMPSLNEYITTCRANRYAGAKMKKNLEAEIMPHLAGLPKFQNPIRITFWWVEENRRRDLDNICSAKKFILDALVKGGYLKDDNRKCVTRFVDNFAYAKKAKVIMLIQECKYVREIDFDSNLYSNGN